MWPSLIDKAKQGGLDVIQTYVFWNVHEPVEGQVRTKRPVPQPRPFLFLLLPLCCCDDHSSPVLWMPLLSRRRRLLLQFNFQGRYDLVGFVKLIQAHGLYVSVRIGPFIESEWKGLPFWLHDVPGIIFRSDNEPFKYHMQRFTTMIVNMMKSEGLYASQGGPIILSQIENEYKNVEAAFHEKGPPYVRWAAAMAVGLQTGVPWVMCKQDDAPDPVINACNGMNCGETFAGPNSPNKPAIWTENWTSMERRLSLYRGGAAAVGGLTHPLLNPTRQMHWWGFIQGREYRFRTQFWLGLKQSGLLGEKLKIYTPDGSTQVKWTTAGISTQQRLMWFKTTFDAPSGLDPVTLNLGSMGKGEVWINGESIGRYWVSLKTPEGQPSQSLYHIPRSFLKPSGNLLVLFEEEMGDPLHISIDTISVTSVCSIVSDSHPRSLLSRKKRPSVDLQCPGGKAIARVDFASYGTPVGDCESYAIGSCHSVSSKAIVEKACLGKGSCSLLVSAKQFGGDPCPGTSKSLLVLASCH
ncbi:hypothetical protein Taro_037145 [Colocasia esculenta]|uniref:beta-galactosidase n=1 Tax=Colocasia esculenta TaxID=4460 RepID=A0A843WIC1_COLES|nr:hypothetical protein [Colocasia esculenta]